MGNALRFVPFFKGTDMYVTMVEKELYKVYEDIIEKNDSTDPTKEFDNFHLAILELFRRLNASVIGKHIVLPSINEIESLHKKWKETEKPEEKKKLFKEMVVSSLKPSKTSTTVLLAGVAAPPAALVAKRAGEKLPQLKPIKFVPDFIFVPAATVVMISSVKYMQSVS